MRTLAAVTTTIFFLAQPVLAGFERWTYEVETDPFTKGTRVTVDYLASIREAVLVFCDSSQAGVTIRIVPGWEGEASAFDVFSGAAIAVDGEVLEVSLADAATGSVGSGQVTAEIYLRGEDAKLFLESFTGARSELGFKDGISSAALIVSANGSTAAGEQLLACYNAQEGSVERSAIQESASTE
ncbi:hypothetical protein FQV27_00010 [Paracoccus aurantiacus]|uniref:Uncharacterized protein n=1 Tax=Paracoccus aurantiacus TaxID=2599412 RepID=A0A5C6S7H7_9RHOB|nr:hypothetical protein [Paracoccus aurantiacus]TXB70308.1 hypothetical protein FQV27_00010 [Paracoccus aurantiacus]